MLFSYKISQKSLKMESVDRKLNAQKETKLIQVQRSNKNWDHGCVVIQVRAGIVLFSLLGFAQFVHLYQFS